MSDALRDDDLLGNVDLAKRDRGTTGAAGWSPAPSHRSGKPSGEEERASVIRRDGISCRWTRECFRTRRTQT